MVAEKFTIRGKVFAVIGAILAVLFVLSGVGYGFGSRAAAADTPESYTAIRITQTASSFTTDLTADMLNSTTYFKVEGTVDGTS